MASTQRVAEDDTALNKQVVQPLLQFVNNSTQLLRTCHKPDQKEYMKVLMATGIGFLIMGGVGFVVKLLHIPVNNMLVGA